ncbi:hypothetical protein FGO68_gene8425 [Halteria grandinella]|uniref:Transmembrane protein n=1 Tax=Halteria grandinella TaxID=5974 RepID=A0A8J8SWX8_HALGN|nr:hypothetical protein FGO68_gene8425 [Halteria grandinella]
MGDSALQSERDVYFVLNNTNGDLHYQLKIFGTIFSDQKIEEINKNMVTLTGVSLGVIAIILMSGFVVIPLFGKIQNRILELMKLFFAIDMTVKRSIIGRIDAFLRAYYKTSQKRSLKRLRTSGSSLNEELEGDEGPSETILYQQRILAAQQAAIIEDEKTKKKQTQQRKFGKMAQAFGLNGKKKDGKINVESLERIEEEEVKNDKPNKGIKSKKKHQKKKKGKGVDLDEIEIEVQEGKTVKIKKKRTYEEDNTFDSPTEDSKHDEEDKETAMKHKLDEIQKAKLDAVFAKEQEVILEFSKYTNKRKIIQALFVVVLLSIMASYFLIKYLLSLSLFDKMSRSVDDLQIIFGRLACSQNVLNTYVESYFSTDLIQSSNPDFASLNTRIDDCMLTERDYQLNIINRPVTYLSDALDYIRLIEGGDLCNEYVNLTISYQQCLDISDQIRKQGLSTYYFNIMKSVKQMELDLSSAIREQGGINKTFVMGQLNSKIATYVDTLILVVLPTQSVIQTRALQSISDYFNNQQTLLSVIFAAYLTVTLLLAVYFVFSMYVKLRKEMLASNRLLYIIDFESLQEAERQIILKFLMNY